MPQVSVIPSLISLLPQVLSLQFNPMSLYMLGWWRAIISCFYLYNSKNCIKPYVSIPSVGQTTLYRLLAELFDMYREYTKLFPIIVNRPFYEEIL